MKETYELTVEPCAFTAPFIAWHGDEAISDLELHATARGRVPGAGEDPDYERVWREIDPKAFEEVDR